MSPWLWVNLGLGALFVLAIVGVPMWLVIRRPDTPPTFADLPSWRRAREHRATRAPARQAPARQAAAQQRVPRQATPEPRLPYQAAGQRRYPAAGS